MPDTEGTDLVTQLFERQRACGKLPGWKIRADILALDRSIRIFTGNARQLADHLEAHSSVPASLALWSRDNLGGQDEFLDEVDRLVHNYLASAMSLKDHSSRIAQRRLGVSADDDLAARYEEGVRAVFAQSPLAQFVQCLRNYTVHRRIPVTRGHVRWSRDEGYEANVVIPTSQLLLWDKWTAPAQEFIADAGDQVVLREVVTTYTGAVREFHRWFRQALRWRNRVALGELQDEETAIALAFSEVTGGPITRRPVRDPTSNAPPEA